ncbi:MAG: hypothetical protein QM537_04575 [Candidatus Symbiobacter sp.]|nr:hypothetical protein [Candidatus Symbiobacter sp.]
MTDITNELPIFEPKVRLFMSVDLIGSTPKKQTGGVLPLSRIYSNPPKPDKADSSDNKSKSDDTLFYPRWHRPIFKFFSEFEASMELYKREYKKFCGLKNQKHYCDPRHEPVVWKYKGDEIIYTVLLTDSLHMLQSIILFLRALQKFRHDSGFRKGHGDWDESITNKTINVPNSNDKTKELLNAKATIWLAGFPILNSEIGINIPKNIDLGDSNDLESEGVEPTIANLIELVLLADLNSDEALSKLSEYLNSKNFQCSDVLQETKEIQDILDIIKSYLNGSFSKIDFVGPSIDIGFRLTSLANERKVPISFEVAYILALIGKRNSSLGDDFSQKINFLMEWCKDIELYCNGALRKSQRPKSMKSVFFANLFYDGGIKLKGVFNDKNYPYFWLRSPYTQIDADTEKVTNKRGINLSVIERYCEKIFKDKITFIFKPFIKGCVVTGEPLPEYQTIIEKWKARYERDKEIYNSTRRAAIFVPQKVSKEEKIAAENAANRIAGFLT